MASQAPSLQINHCYCASHAVGRGATMVVALALTVIGGLCLQNILPGIGIVVSSAMLGAGLGGIVITTLLPGFPTLIKSLQAGYCALKNKTASFKEDLECGLAEAITQAGNNTDLISHYNSLANELKVAYVNRSKELKLNLCYSAVSPQFISVLKHFKHLEKLTIYGQTLTELPSVIVDLPNLKTLDVSYCTQLTKLAPNINKLQKLENFLADETGITELPPGICTLPNLVKLSMHTSKLKTLPDQIQKLIDTNREVTLIGNPINSLPDVLATDRNLQWLCMHLIRHKNSENNLLSGITFFPPTEYLEALAQRFKDAPSSQGLLVDIIRK